MAFVPSVHTRALGNLGSADGLRKTRVGGRRSATTTMATQVQRSYEFSKRQASLWAPADTEEEIQRRAEHSRVKGVIVPGLFDLSGESVDSGPKTSDAHLTWIKDRDAPRKLQTEPSLELQQTVESIVNNRHGSNPQNRPAWSAPSKPPATITSYKSAARGPARSIPSTPRLEQERIERQLPRVGRDDYKVSESSTDSERSSSLSDQKVRVIAPERVSANGGPSRARRVAQAPVVLAATLERKPETAVERRSTAEPAQANDALKAAPAPSVVKASSSSVKPAVIFSTSTVSRQSSSVNGLDSAKVGQDTSSRPRSQSDAAESSNGAFWKKPSARSSKPTSGASHAPAPEPQTRAAAAKGAPWSVRRSTPRNSRSYSNGQAVPPATPGRANPQEPNVIVPGNEREGAKQLVYASAASADSQAAESTVSTVTMAYATGNSFASAGQESKEPSKESDTGSNSSSDGSYIASLDQVFSGMVRGFARILGFSRKD